MRDYKRLIAIVASAALVAGCRKESPVQPGTGPTAQAAPALTRDDDISAIFATVLGFSTVPDVHSALPDAHSAIQESHAHRASVVVATAVVLMPRLPVADAAAVVVRRPNLWPASVVMLREDSLTVGTLYSALVALSNEVTREGGAEAPSTTQMLQIQGQELPAAERERNATQWMLGRLKRAPRRTVAGVGAYPAFVFRTGAYAKPDSL